MVATRQEIEAIATDYVRSLKKHGIRVEEVILFGSYARGDARDNSDIDLAFISDDFEKYNAVERQRLLAACRNGFAPTEVVGYSRRMLREKASSSPLAEAVLSKGQPLHTGT